jgi:hypothetical protein
MPAMITRQRAVVLLGLLLFTASSALAEPISIHITHGALVGPRTGAALRVRQHGLAIDASGAYPSGVWGISLCPCSPGALLPFDGIWSGSDLPGVVTVRGRTFPVGFASDDTGYLDFFFRATTVLPAFAGQRSISVRTPFSFDGLLVTPTYPDHLFSTYELSGTGRATLQFQWLPSDSAWFGHSARYNFVATPEPSTLGMTGVAVAGLLARFRRRRGRRMAPRANLHGRPDA